MAAANSVFWEDYNATSNVTSAPDSFSSYTRFLDTSSQHRNEYDGNAPIPTYHGAFIEPKDKSDTKSKWRLAPIDMHRMTQLWTFATKKDPIVMQCLRYMEEETFKGGVVINFGGSDAVDELSRLLSLCKSALAASIAERKNKRRQRRRRRRRQRNDTSLSIEQAADELVLDQIADDAREHTIKLLRDKRTPQTTADDDDDDSDSDSDSDSEPKKKKKKKKRMEDEDNNNSSGDDVTAVVGDVELSNENSTREINEERERVMRQELDIARKMFRKNTDTEPLPTANKRKREQGNDDDDNNNNNNNNEGDDDGDSEFMRVSKESMRQMVALARGAVRWRAIFGFVPIVFNVEDGVTRMNIPEFGTVRFGLLIDVETGKTFVVAYATEKEKQPGGDNNINNNDVDNNLSKRVRVFTWRGMEPSLDGRLFSTPIAMLYHDWVGLTAHMNFNRRAHEYGSYPPMVIAAPRREAPQPMDNMDDATYFSNIGLEQQMTNGGAAASLPEEQQYYRRNRMRLLTQMSMDDRATESLVNNEHSYATVSDGTGRLYNGMSVPPHLGNRLELTEGTTVQHTQLPMLEMAQVAQMRTAYNELVCNALGVPPDMVLASGGSGGGRSAYSCMSAKGRSGVRRERERTVEFIKHIYEILFRSRDDRRLIELVLSSQEVLKAMNSGGGEQQREEGETYNAADYMRAIDEQRRGSEATRALERELERVRLVIASNFRAVVRFPGDQVPTSLEPNDLLLMRQEGCLTPDEFVNAMRALANIDPVTKGSQLVRERETIEQIRFHQLYSLGGGGVDDDDDNNKPKTTGGGGGDGQRRRKKGEEGEEGIPKELTKKKQ